MNITRGFYSQKCNTQNTCKTNTAGDLPSGIQVNMNNLTTSSNYSPGRSKRPNETIYQYFKRLGVTNKDELTELSRFNVYANYSLSANLIDFEKLESISSITILLEGYVIGSYVLEATVEIFDLNGIKLGTTLSDDQWGDFSLTNEINANTSHGLIKGSGGKIVYSSDLNFSNDNEYVSYVNFSNFNIDSVSNIPSQNLNVLTTILSEALNSSLGDANILFSSEIDEAISINKIKLVNWLNSVVYKDFKFSEDLDISLNISQLDIDYVRETML